MGREDGGEFAPEGLVPCGVRATRAGNDKSAIHDVSFEVLPFFFRQGEVSLAGENTEGGFKDLVGGEFQAGEARGNLELGRLGGAGEKFVGKAHRGLVFSVNEIAADDFRFLSAGEGGEEGEGEKDTFHGIVIWVG